MYGYVRVYRGTSTGLDVVHGVDDEGAAALAQAARALPNLRTLVLRGNHAFAVVFAVTLGATRVTH